MVPQTPTARRPVSDAERPLALPHAALLESWARRAWTNGCQVDELPDLQVLTVITRNSVYEIIVLSARAGEVLVRGGRFFPARRAARLAGSSLGGSFLKMRGIYVGFRMELHAEGGAIVTSPVQSILIGQTDGAVRH